METVDKLRGYCDKLRNVDDNCVSAEYVAERCAIDVRRLADEIEREIAERYMELPVDMDGVPIRVGDRVCSPNAGGGEYDVFAIACNHWVDIDGFKHNPAGTLHVKPRTVEDVLTDLAEDVERGCPPLNAVAKYIGELRELMGVER